MATCRMAAFRPAALPRERGMRCEKRSHSQVPHRRLAMVLAARGNGRTHGRIHEEQRQASSTPSVRSRRPTVPTVWNSYCDACRRGRPEGTGRRRGVQGILEQGETSDGPKGIRKTQTAIQRPPIGRSATRPIKMSPLPPSETVRTIGGDGQNKNTTTKGEKTWPKPHRPTACSSNSRCSPISRRKPYSRLRRSPSKPSRASDIIRKPETGTGTKKLNRTPIVRTEEIQIRRSGAVLSYA